MVNKTLEELFSDGINEFCCVEEEIQQKRMRFLNAAISGVLPMFLIILHSTFVNGIFHFYVESGERRCFYKELIKDMVLIGRYKLEIHDDDSGRYINPPKKAETGILIEIEEVFDMDHRIVHQKGLPNGQFIFSVLESGEHRLCYTPKSFAKKRWLESGSDTHLKASNFKRARISIDLLIGDGLMTDEAKSDETGVIAELIELLNDKLIDIRREQKFIREKEELFRDQSERTCEKVVRWLIIQVGALLITCIYQLLCFLDFFKKEKIA